MSDFTRWMRNTFPFAYTPLAAAAARAASSTQPASQDLGKQVLAVVATAAVDAGQSIQSGNSAMAAGSSLIADLENGANNLAAAYVEGLVAGVPIAGEFMAPEAKKVVLVGLEFGEQHLHNMIAALFANHKAAVIAAPVLQPVNAPAPIASVSGSADTTVSALNG